MNGVDLQIEHYLMFPEGGNSSWVSNMCYLTLAFTAMNSKLESISDFKYSIQQLS
jgi:hypothetical protein